MAALKKAPLDSRHTDTECHQPTGLRLSPTGNCLGNRPYLPEKKTYGDYVWQSYEHVALRVTNFGSGLLELSRQYLNVPATQWHLGLYALNRPEWAIADWAVSAYSLVSVSLYDTLGADAATYIVNHAEIPVIVTSIDKIEILLKSHKEMPTLKIIICIESLADFSPARPNSPSTATLLHAWAKDCGIQLFEFAQVEQIGKEKPRPHVPPKPDDLYTICYTSGTTGVVGVALRCWCSALQLPTHISLCSQKAHCSRTGTSQRQPCQ